MICVPRFRVPPPARQWSNGVGVLKAVGRGVDTTILSSNADQIVKGDHGYQFHHTASSSRRSTPIACRHPRWRRGLSVTGPQLAAVPTASSSRWDLMSEAVNPQGAPNEASPVGRPPIAIGAYVLLADPAYLEMSIRSYYDLCDEIIICYDESGLGWTGAVLPMADLLDAVHRLDPEKKFKYLPGNFHGSTMQPMEAETAQRNFAIDELGDRVDWILQIDTDEVLGNQRRFSESLMTAHDSGMAALDYPSRWIYGHCSGRLFLERCRRTWGIAAGYPGPVAVTSGTEVTLARQCGNPVWRVDFRGRNTDPGRSRTARVDERVPPADGIWHFSWVRSEAEMRKKATTSAHAGDLDWDKEIDRWLLRRRHPYLTTAGTPVRRHPSRASAPTWLRTVRLPSDLASGPTPP
jgi:hypothetical protein